MQMHWVDIIILSVLGLSVLTGMFRGFLKELIALAVWVLAIWAAYHYSQLLDSRLSPWIADESARKAIGFAAVFLAVLLSGAIVNAVLGFILNKTGMSGPDRLLGMGFGFVRGVFIIALGVVAIRMTSLPEQKYIKESVLYAQFNPVADWIGQQMPALIEQVKAQYPQRQIMKLNQEDTISSLMPLDVSPQDPVDNA